MINTVATKAPSSQPTIDVAAPDTPPAAASIDTAIPSPSQATPAKKTKVRARQTAVKQTAKRASSAKPASKSLHKPASRPQSGVVAKTSAAPAKRLSVAAAPIAAPVQKRSPEPPVPVNQQTSPAGPVADKARAMSSGKASVKVNNARKSAERKEKLVRDSFTMPHDDYALIASLKDRAVMFKRPTKKSELLRAGLHALQAMPATALRAALDTLSPLKSGRPKKSVI